MMKSVFITLPISPKVMLEISWKPSLAKIFPGTKERAKLYNRQRAGFAERYIYSSIQDAGIAALTEKNRENGPRFKVDGPHKLADIVIKRKLDP
jgi:hypothetical protein